MCIRDRCSFLWRDLSRAIAVSNFEQSAAATVRKRVAADYATHSRYVLQRLRLWIAGSPPTQRAGTTERYALSLECRPEVRSMALARYSGAVSYTHLKSQMPCGNFIVIRFIAIDHFLRVVPG